MHDALRAARLDSAFLAAADLWLIETSAPLAALQRERLADDPLSPTWATNLDDLPDDAPLILIANELLDCLPARQFVQTPAGWARADGGAGRGRRIGFGLAPCRGPRADRRAPLGAVVEISDRPGRLRRRRSPAPRRNGGAALLIDYGGDRPGVRRHPAGLAAARKVDPLAIRAGPTSPSTPTFPRCCAAARAAGVQAAPADPGRLPAPAGDRAARRGAGPRPARPGARDRPPACAADRTTTRWDELFKAACLYRRRRPAPAGFRRTPMTDLAPLQSPLLAAAARRAPRLLHPARRDLARPLRQPQCRPGSGDEPAAVAREPRARGGAGSAAGPEDLAHRLPDPLGHRPRRPMRHGRQPPEGDAIVTVRRRAGAGRPVRRLRPGADRRRAKPASSPPSTPAGAGRWAAWSRPAVEAMVGHGRRSRPHGGRGRPLHRPGLL